LFRGRQVLERSKSLCDSAFVSSGPERPVVTVDGTGVEAKTTLRVVRPCSRPRWTRGSVGVKRTAYRVALSWRFVVTRHASGLESALGFTLLTRAGEPRPEPSRPFRSYP
jgi:hypothetical protein